MGILTFELLQSVTRLRRHPYCWPPPQRSVNTRYPYVTVICSMGSSRRLGFRKRTVPYGRRVEGSSIGDLHSVPLYLIELGGAEVVMLA